MAQRRRRTCSAFAVLAVMCSSAWAAAERSPVLMDAHRLGLDEHGEAWLEDRWPGRYDIGEIEVRIPAGDGSLSGWDHLLHVALLGEDGAWSVVAEVHVSPERVPARPLSPLADDREALAFLARIGSTLQQFEFIADSALGSRLPDLWQAQGIARDDIPEAILRRLAGDDAAPEAMGAAADAPGAWSRPLGSIVYRLVLPGGVLAEGVRFSLTGERPRGEGWQLSVRTVAHPEIPEMTRRDWTYTHVW